MLDADAVSVTDGGGRATAALAPIRGAERVARFFVGLLRKAPPGFVPRLRLASCNGVP